MFSEKYRGMIAIFRDSLFKVAFNTNFFSNVLVTCSNILLHYSGLSENFEHVKKKGKRARL